MPTPPKGRFGPGVIGQEAFDAEQEYLTEHKDVFGPAVVGDHPPTPPPGGPAPPIEETPEPSTDAETPADDPYMVSTKKLAAILAANPLEVDAFVRAELARPEGMRVTALKAMLAAENERPGADGSVAPRAEVVSMLEGAIGEVSAAHEAQAAAVTAQAEAGGQ